MCFVVVVLMNMLIAIMGDSCEMLPAAFNLHNNMFRLNSCCTCAKQNSVPVACCDADEKVKESERVEALRSVPSLHQYLVHVDEDCNIIVLESFCFLLTYCVHDTAAYNHGSTAGSGR
eukprot:SAG22_NODE_1346_length_4674_cov_2.003934_4_plen_118_part_00